MKKSLQAFAKLDAFGDQGDDVFWKYILMIIIVITLMDIKSVNNEIGVDDGDADDAGHDNIICNHWGWCTSNTYRQ